jgi:hypothetical protein
MGDLYAQWRELPGMREHFPDTRLNMEQAKLFLCDGTHSVVATLRLMAYHHRGQDAPPMDEGPFTAHRATGGENAIAGGATDMNDEPEELPDTCAEIQLYHMADLISENDPTRREQWGHVQSCLSCLSTYLEARDWAAELGASAWSAWRALLRFDRCSAMMDTVTALVKDVQGTLRNFPPTFQGPVMLFSGNLGFADSSLSRDRSAPSVEDRGKREPEALTVDLEGFQFEVAVEATPAGPRMSVAMRAAPYPAAIKVRLGEVETTLGGVGATGELPLQEGQVEVQIIRDSDTAS